jgi:hypothetical protein
MYRNAEEERGRGGGENPYFPSAGTPTSELHHGESQTEEIVDGVISSRLIDEIWQAAM